MTKSNNDNINSPHIQFFRLETPHRLLQNDLIRFLGNVIIDCPIRCIPPKCFELSARHRRNIGRLATITKQCASMPEFELRPLRDLGMSRQICCPLSCYEESSVLIDFPYLLILNSIRNSRVGTSFVVWKRSHKTIPHPPFHRIISY